MAEKLIDYLKQLEATDPPRFTAPQVYYGAKEDSLLFYFRNDESYAHRLNDLVTLFLSFDGDALVGCQIKGVRRKLKTGGNFSIAIKKQGEVELGLFFHLLAYETPEPEPRNRLVELGQKAKGLVVGTEEAPSAC